MDERLKDVFTVPNLITLGRLVLSPLVAKKLHDQPAKWWLPAGAFLATDGLDGFAAKFIGKSKFMAEIGFRQSEFGRKLDPFTDKIVTSEMLAAGLKNGVIPKSLGGLSLAQKAVISTAVACKTANHEEIHVNEAGRRSELLTNVGFGLMFAAENIDDHKTKRLALEASAGITMTGIRGAVMASRDYLASSASETPS